MAKSTFTLSKKSKFSIVGSKIMRGLKTGGKWIGEKVKNIGDLIYENPEAIETIVEDVLNIVDVGFSLYELKHNSSVTNSITNDLSKCVNNIITEKVIESDRKSPIEHQVSGYVRSNGTVVAPYTRGGKKD